MQKYLDSYLNDKTWMREMTIAEIVAFSDDSLFMAIVLQTNEQLKTYLWKHKDQRLNLKKICPSSLFDQIYGDMIEAAYLEATITGDRITLISYALHTADSVGHL